MSRQGDVHDYGSDIYTEADGQDDTLANLGPLRRLAGMWQSTTWNGQESAFRFVTVILGVLIWRTQPLPARTIRWASRAVGRN